METFAKYLAQYGDGGAFVMHTHPPGIPEPILRGLYGWWKDRHRPGDFLVSVLENDLAAAVARADPISIAAIKPIMLFVYNELPQNCWGSPEMVRAWQEGKEGA